MAPTQNDTHPGAFPVLQGHFAVSTHSVYALSQGQSSNGSYLTRTQCTGTAARLARLEGLCRWDTQCKWLGRLPFTQGRLRSPAAALTVAWSRLRSRPAVPATLVIGHVSRLSCTCCLWRILRISRRRMRLFHFTPLVSARQQAAAAATSSCQPS